MEFLLCGFPPTKLKPSNILRFHGALLRNELGPRSIAGWVLLQKGSEDGASEGRQEAQDAHENRKGHEKREIPDLSGGPLSLHRSGPLIFNSASDLSVFQRAIPMKLPGLSAWIAPT